VFNFFTLIPSLGHLALQLTDTTLLNHCMPDCAQFGNLDRGSVDFLKALVAVPSKRTGVLFNLVLHHFVIEYYSKT